MNYRKNLEIKTGIKNLASFRKKAAEYSRKAKSSRHFTEEQKDIYYNTGKGRLKLRIKNGKDGVLIYYKRSSASGKRVSNYFLSETSSPKELDSMMREMHGVKVIVEKKREIFLADNVRIHLDSVRGLGKYLEFEIIFNSIKNARRTLDGLIEHFNLDESAFIKGSYSDLLIKKGQ
ncbi:MAG: class IV adenylate cyclase [Bacteroidetes bacterium]|nr:class IV adenylate cyclase [Bacteroidota bacterium]